MRWLNALKLQREVFKRSRPGKSTFSSPRRFGFNWDSVAAIISLGMDCTDSPANLVGQFFVPQGSKQSHFFWRPSIFHDCRNFQQLAYRQYLVDRSYTRASQTNKMANTEQARLGGKGEAVPTVNRLLRMTVGLFCSVTKRAAGMER